MWKKGALPHVLLFKDSSLFSYIASGLDLEKLKTSLGREGWGGVGVGWGGVGAYFEILFLLVDM